ncbi:hypothetical protein ACFVP8_16130 [Viridibacillus arvi]|uniref:hypothetical protein n=1 Tax=Viridibacillus arvi TaxID=263475 RepID=UPI0036C7092D
MHSALLPSGNIITAREYEPERHGTIIYCMDKSCQVPVIHMSGTLDVAAHFKSSGRGDSIHKECCGFARKLTFKETVGKVGEYQDNLLDQGVREFVVRLSLNSIDPDYEAKTIERNTSDKEQKEPEELDSKALKEKSVTPQAISSLKSIKKLFTTVEPDILASIIISANGIRIPISQIICHYEMAHNVLWEDKALPVPYFIHGKVSKVIRREKVWYINFLSENAAHFTLVVFDRYFKHFTLKDEDLIGKEILAVGTLKKNSFNREKQITEMIIKSNKYIEFL